MGRLPRPTGDDLIYHAINRGNNRANVLGPEGERDMFLGDLARTKARYPFALFGYCLVSATAWCRFIFSGVIRFRFISSGKNDELPSREGAPGGLDRASGFPFPL